MKCGKLTCLAFVVVVLVLAFVVLPVATGYAQTKSSEATLDIGLLFGLTGFISSRDLPDYNETLIAADVLNERGGVTVKGQKYKFRMVAEDTKSTMDGVASAANRLAFDKKVKFVIGPLDFFAPAANQVLNPAKVLRVLHWSGISPGEVDASTPYTFLGGNATVANALTVVKYLKKAYPNVKKIAFVTPDDGSVPYLFPAIKGLLESNGITVVGDAIAFANEAQDYSPISAKINAVKEADAAAQFNGHLPQICGIVKGLRQLGNTKPYYAAVPTAMSEIVPIIGKTAAKDVITNSISYDDPSIPPIAKEICDKTVAKYGKEYSLYLNGAQSLYALKVAIEAAQSFDTTVVKTKWESMTKMDTLFGPGNVGGKKTFGINHVVTHPQVVQVLKNGVVTSAGWFDTGMIP